MNEYSQNQTLIARLQKALSKERLVMFFAGLILSASVMLGVVTALSLLANFLVLEVWLKIPLLIFAALLAGYLFIRLAFLRLFSGTVDSLAVRVEQTNPGLRGRLIAAVQFARLKSGHGFSDELIESTHSQANKRSADLDFGQVVSAKPISESGRFLAGVTVLTLALLFFVPGLYSYSYEVYSHPASVIAPPIAYQLIPFPGSTEWVKHKDIQIGASVVGQRIPDKAKIHYRLAGGSWQTSRVEIASGGSVDISESDSLEVRMTLRQITRSFDYYVEAGRVQTEIQHVDVVDRPRVTGIDLAVFYPKYTGLEPMTISENNGSFSAIMGSRVNMKVTSNLPVDSASLIFEDASDSPLTVERNSAELSMSIMESRSYYIRLVDHLGEINPDPIEYYITSIPDEYPTVDVLRPGFDANLTDELRVPFKIRLFDDFGFSSLVLKYKVVARGRSGDEHVAVLHFSDDIKTEGEIEFDWDLDQFNLFPGDYISYYFEVTDNDEISGPKIGKSRSYIIRLPSLDELIADAETDGSERIVRTEDLLKSAKELVDRLKKAGRKLDANIDRNQKNNSADWQQQKELESIAGKNEDMLQKIEDISESMEQSLDEMRENALMSREVMEKMEQIQKLFEEIASPEMKEAQKKLLEALQKMDREQIEQAMKDFEMNQEEMLDRLERTLALLKKMQLEQKMEAMIRKAEELVDRQEDMNQKTDSSDQNSLPDLKSDEDKIREELADLKEDVADLEKLMKEANLENSPEAKKFAEAVEKTDADKNMEQMSKSLQQQERQEASQQGKKAKSKLAEMLNEMQQQQMAMSGADDQEMERAMRRAIDDANYLSRSQEDLLREAAVLSPRSTMIREIAGDQQEIARSSEGLRDVIADLGKKSPFVAAELQQILNSAMANMEQATQKFDARQTGQALRNQRNAMVDLNKAAQRLLESLDQQKQCNNAGSCDKPTQDLESLSKKQNQLNQKSQKPGGNQQPNFETGMPDREGLKRLAAEQGAIRKSLEQLERDLGGSRQILGRLKDIAREMKKIEESLESGEVGSEVRERQLKVYSRMLEASRSLQRKDFSEQRKSEVATNETILLPPELSGNILDDRTSIEDRLRRFLGDEYPAQYEDQIKAYFRALLRIESEQSNGGPVSPSASGSAGDSPPSGGR